MEALCVRRLHDHVPRRLMDASASRGVDIEDAMLMEALWRSLQENNNTNTGGFGEDIDDRHAAPRRRTVRSPMWDETAEREEEERMLAAAISLSLADDGDARDEAQQRRRETPPQSEETIGGASAVAHAVPAMREVTMDALLDPCFQHDLSTTPTPHGDIENHRSPVHQRRGRTNNPFLAS